MTKSKELKNPLSHLPALTSEAVQHIKHAIQKTYDYVDGNHELFFLFPSPKKYEELTGNEKAFEEIANLIIPYDKYGNNFGIGKDFFNSEWFDRIMGVMSVASWAGGPEGATAFSVFKMGMDITKPKTNVLKQLVTAIKSIIEEAIDTDNAEKMIAHINSCKDYLEIDFHKKIISVNHKVTDTKDIDVELSKLDEISGALELRLSGLKDHMEFYNLKDNQEKGLYLFASSIFIELSLNKAKEITEYHKNLFESEDAEIDEQGIVDEHLNTSYNQLKEQINSIFFKYCFPVNNCRKDTSLKDVLSDENLRYFSLDYLEEMNTSEKLKWSISSNLNPLEGGVSFIDYDSSPFMHLDENKIPEAKDIKNVQNYRSLVHKAILSKYYAIAYKHYPLFQYLSQLKAIIDEGVKYEERVLTEDMIPELKQI